MRLQPNRLILTFAAALLFVAVGMGPPDLGGDQRAAIYDKDRPDRPDELLKFRRLQLQDERGYIPADGLEKARHHVKLMKLAQKDRIKKRISPLAAGIEPDSWTWLGPGNIGGRIRAMLVSPTNANNMWVGSVAGGLWRTTNAGASWQPVDDFLANLAVSTIVINPANPSVLYEYR